MPPFCASINQWAMTIRAFGVHRREWLWSAGRWNRGMQERTQKSEAIADRICDYSILRSTLYRCYCRTTQKWWNFGSKKTLGLGAKSGKWIQTLISVHCFLEMLNLDILLIAFLAVFTGIQLSEVILGGICSKHGTKCHYYLYPFFG